jgi:hypothetical protein
MTGTAIIITTTTIVATDSVSEARVPGPPSFEFIRLRVDRRPKD